LVGRPEGKRALGRPRRRWEDNIKTYLQEVGWGAWTVLMWFRVRPGGRGVSCGIELSGSIKCGEFLH